MAHHLGSSEVSEPSQIVLFAAVDLDCELVLGVVYAAGFFPSRCAGSKEAGVLGVGQAGLHLDLVVGDEDEAVDPVAQFRREVQQR